LQLIYFVIDSIYNEYIKSYDYFKSSNQTSLQIAVCIVLKVSPFSDVTYCKTIVQLHEKSLMLKVAS